MGLSLSDIDRVNPDAIVEIFTHADAHAVVTNGVRESLDGLPTMKSWGGPAGEAAARAVGKKRVDFDSHGQEVKQVGSIAAAAAVEWRDIKNQLAQVRSEAAGYGLTIDNASGSVILPDMSGWDDDKVSQEEWRQAQVDTKVKEILRAAQLADETLATAIEMADGELSGDDAKNSLQKLADDTKKKEYKFSWMPDWPATVEAYITGVLTSAPQNFAEDLLKYYPENAKNLRITEADIAILKKFSIAGAVVGTIPAISDDIKDGMNPTEAVVTEGAGTVAGFATGVELGGAIGSAIPIPFVGTGIGVVVGGAIGAVVGYGSSKVGQKILDDGN